MKIRIYLLLVFNFIVSATLVAQTNIEFQQLLGENISIQSITYAVKQGQSFTLEISVYCFRYK